MKIYQRKNTGSKRPGPGYYYLMDGFSPVEIGYTFGFTTINDMAADMEVHGYDVTRDKKYFINLAKDPNYSYICDVDPDVPLIEQIPEHML